MRFPQGKEVDEAFREVLNQLVALDKIIYLEDTVTASSGDAIAQDDEKITMLINTGYGSIEQCNQSEGKWNYVISSPGP